MQRTRVDLPVPDGPMIAVRPRPSTVIDTSRSTGWPARYSLRRLRMTSERSISRARGTPVDASMTPASVVLLPRRRLILILLLLLLRLRLGLPSRFRVEGSFVIGCAG